MLQQFVEKVVSAIKKQDYKFAENVGNRDFITIIFERFIQFIRGARARAFINGKGIVFCGKKVRLVHKSNISAGNNLILGDYTMINALSSKGISMGNNITIGRNVEIICTGVIRNLGIGMNIGNNVAIGSGSRIAAQGGVYIGDDTIMGPNVVINAENHIFKDSNIPIRLQGESRKGINIGKNCWIGANVIILDGVSIGDNVVIAAGAVVTKNVESNKLIAGVPAKVIRELT